MLALSEYHLRFEVAAGCDAMRQYTQQSMEQLLMTKAHVAAAGKARLKKVEREPNREMADAVDMALQNTVNLSLNCFVPSRCVGPLKKNEIRKIGTWMHPIRNVPVKRSVVLNKVTGEKRWEVPFRSEDGVRAVPTLHSCADFGSKGDCPKNTGSLCVKWCSWCVFTIVFFILASDIWEASAMVDLVGLCVCAELPCFNDLACDSASHNF